MEKKEDDESDAVHLWGPQRKEGGIETSRQDADWEALAARRGWEHA